jgi:ADP-ribosylglycohydrolase
MMIPEDYIERVYAGVLGKMIGVYLGRPFEGWSYERIMAELGEITDYVHEKRGVPLIVTDDDLSGTFTFVRALQDHAHGRDITAAQIGQSWLNYVLERRTIFWWGGMGNSTEHTAFIRLKQGIPAPQSGSIATNGKIVAEQIGSQIFIDGWAMVAPGDPQLAAELARKAASVSHDGEAIYGAQVVAAMEAAAFVESDTNRLLDTAVGLIPRDSVIYRMIADLREWHAKEPDWRKTRDFIVKNYGYDQYVGGCHMVPNHALIILGLLYGEDDFQKSLMITNTSGWDTDCNSGNIGCLMGIKLGLAGIDAAPVDFRGPVADRLLLPTADGGNAISDAVRETFRIVNIGLGLAGKAEVHPKNGARFHFELPGSVQSFRAEAGEDNLPGVTLRNVAWKGGTGERALCLSFEDLRPGCFARTATPTFMLPEDVKMPGYSLYASPTLYPGQTVRAALAASQASSSAVQARLFLRCYGGDDLPEKVDGPIVRLAAGQANELGWTIPDLDGKSVFEIGVEMSAEEPASGEVYLDYLSWSGAPQTTFKKVPGSGKLWRSAWVDGIDQWERWGIFILVQNYGRGLISTGGTDWKDYRVSTPLKMAMGRAAGVGARVQGVHRFYGLFLCQGGKLRLVKALEGGDRVLGEVDFAWELWSEHEMTLEVQGSRIVGSVDGTCYFDVLDADRPLLSGGVALICEEGHIRTSQVTVSPAG